MRFKDKVGIVTGSASGFGFEIARRFAEEGGSVVVVDLNPEAGERAAAKISDAGHKSVFCEADVATRAGADAMVKAAVDSFGGLDVLVNNAGVPQRPCHFAALDENHYDLMFAVNAKAIYLSAAAALSAFKSGGGGVIVNTTSIGGSRPRPGMSAYAASKAAANAITKALALEMASDNVRVNAVAPVAGDTPMLSEFMGGEPSEDKRQAFVNSVPLGRLSTPQDVASAILFLASDEASLITGAELAVDGGRGV
ncbi:glucose 1-dehydrogenase [Roseovarius pelagicus]|uniref:Glucose 1-dehydrogenase n=1 Tax=Roseovarius pelagicus TaxID=2980108 RepID=A0ABY6D5V7_9RHOB|nr:glucose 1-dehydrogenase [Roseovarius pelagicus]UXX81488.1 glucose 1-dehydrogenase [Roseovarius pelagicus]